MRQADLPGGDLPDDADYADHEEDDDWLEAKVLMETIADDELRTKTPAVRRFNCVRTFGAVIWDLSSWRTTRDKIILKLRKDAVGVTWRAIM